MEDTQTMPVRRATPKTANLAKPNQTYVGIFPGQGPGDDDVTALVRTTPSGLVRAIKTHVTLSKAKGEVYAMRVWDPVEKRSSMAPIITAAGYDRLNLFAGVTFIAPETVAGDDGTPRPNPYMHRDETTGELRFVRVRQVGVGRNAMGNLVMHDLTLNYDLGMYLAQDLMSKWTGKASDSVREWGKLVPTGLDVPKHFACQQAYPLPGSATLVTDLENKEVVRCIQEHINRQKFAERNALTICRRNVLKKFLAASKLDDSLSVAVVGWSQVDRDLNQLKIMAASANDGRVTLEDGETMEVDRDVATVDPEEAEAILVGDADEEMAAPDDEDDAAPGIEPATSTAPEPEPQRVDPLVEQYRGLVKKIGTDDALEALTLAGTRHPNEHSCDQDYTDAITVLRDVLLKNTQAKVDARTNGDPQDPPAGELFDDSKRSTEAFTR